MSVIDYERAWHDLQALIASRDGWGSKTLSQEAIRIAEANRVSEGFVDRALRLYGGATVLSVLNHQGKPSSAPGGMPTGSRDVAPPTEDQGDHDGSEHPRRRRAAAPRSERADDRRVA